jgi:hypothetical protein
MPEVTLTVTKAADGPTFVDAEPDGHAYANDGQTLLFVKDETGGAFTITHVEQGTCDFGHGGTNTTDIAAANDTTGIWAARNVVRWNDSAGKAHITISATVPDDATLQIAAVTYIET